VKPVGPSTLLVVALSATVVEMEGLAGIGSRPTPFQVITLAVATVATCWLVWINVTESENYSKKNSSDLRARNSQGIVLARKQ
jgi:membrane protein implicated in regulation of membrane protease activity